MRELDQTSQTVGPSRLWRWLRNGVDGCFVVGGIALMVYAERLGEWLPADSGTVRVMGLTLLIVLMKQWFLVWRANRVGRDPDKARRWIDTRLRALALIFFAGNVAIVTAFTVWIFRSEMSVALFLVSMMILLFALLLSSLGSSMLFFLTMVSIRNTRFFDERNQKVFLWIVIIASGSMNFFIIFLYLFDRVLNINTDFSTAVIFSLLFGFEVFIGQLIYHEWRERRP